MVFFSYFFRKGPFRDTTKFDEIDLKKIDEKMSKMGPLHETSNNVVCATSKVSDQPAHTRSLTRAFASRLNIL